jgi:predicted HAD superfamily Cof-like phosphohydrolase
MNDLRKITDPLASKILIFNWSYGVIKDIDEAFVPNNTTDIFKKAYHLIISEVRELEKAINDNDKVETIDALGDIIYLLYGLAIRMGIYCETFVSSHTISSSPNWNQNMLTLVYESVENVGFFQNHPDEMRGSIIRALKVCFVILSSLGVDYYEVVSRIHDSNMQKFANTEQEAQASVEHYKTWVSNTGETYKTPTYRLAPDGKRWVIYDIETKKVLKVKEWVPPNLSDLISK